MEFFMMESQLVFNIYFGFILAFWYHVCPKAYLSKLPQKASKSFLSEIVFPNFSVRKFSILKYSVAVKTKQTSHCSKEVRKTKTFHLIHFLQFGSNCTKSCHEFVQPLFS